jgi:hypothetical protein
VYNSGKIAWADPAYHRLYLESGEQASQSRIDSLYRDLLKRTHWSQFYLSHYDELQIFPRRLLVGLGTCYAQMTRLPKSDFTAPRYREMLQATKQYLLETAKHPLTSKATALKLRLAAKHPRVYLLLLKI